MNYLNTGRHFTNGEVMVLNALQKEKAAADEARILDSERRLDIYRDDFKDVLLARLGQQFTDENRKELEKVIDLTQNPCKRIIREISTIYHEAPTWKMAEGNEAALELWRSMLDDGLWPVVAQLNNELVNLCNECLIHPVVRNGKMQWDLITTNQVKVEQDPLNPCEPYSIRYSQGLVNDPKAKPIWHYWNRDPEYPRHAILDAEGRDISSQFGVDGVNPYRDERGNPILPFVIYHRSLPMSDVFDQTSGSDLEEATLLICMMETWINHLMRTDSHQVKYATGLLEAKGSQVAGTTRVLQFSSPSGEAISVGQFASQADWAGLRQVVNDKARNIANAYGLSLNDFQASGDAQSGFALLVRKEGLLEIRRKQLPLYKAYDKQLYAVSAAVWNFERTNQASEAQGPELPWPSKAKPEPVYADLRPAMSITERASEFSLDKDRMALGLETPVTLYQREHPEVGEEDARAAIEANKQLNGELGVSGGLESGAALQAQLEIKKQEMALGIRSLVDLYLEKFPDQSPEQAKATIMANKEINDLLIPANFLAASAGLPPSSLGGGSVSLTNGTPPGDGTTAGSPPSTTPPSIADAVASRLAARRAARKEGDA